MCPIEQSIFYFLSRSYKKVKKTEIKIRTNVTVRNEIRSEEGMFLTHMLYKRCVYWSLHYDITRSSHCSWDCDTLCRWHYVGSLEPVNEL